MAKQGIYLISVNFKYVFKMYNFYFLNRRTIWIAFPLCIKKEIYNNALSHKAALVTANKNCRTSCSALHK